MNGLRTAAATFFVSGERSVTYRLLTNHFTFVLFAFKNDRKIGIRECLKAKS